jgi:hypothetical protein
MSLWDVLQYGIVAAAAILAGRALVGGVWRLAGLYRIRRAGPRPLEASTHRIWRGPDLEEPPDPLHGPGSPDQSPIPPFRFVEEHASGTQPCVTVRDATGRSWRVKWGGEVRAETFAVRFAWACGYFAEVTYFVPSGSIEGAASLDRARPCIEPETGAFCDARFELDDPAVKKLFEEHSWAWDDNPFVGTAELNGLKMVVMLLSNWDAKDRRDVARGSNTAIFEHRLSRRRREARYLLTDWGGSMGRWGTVATRGRWDVAGFEEQTPGFVTGVEGGCVSFGYTGQRTLDIAQGIAVDHVRWFLRHVSRLDEPFLRQALSASGATEEEAVRFARALGDRVRQLEDVVSATARREGRSSPRPESETVDEAGHAGEHGPLARLAASRARATAASGSC